MSTAYTVLGVDPSAPQERITRAHKLLVQLHHPDQGGDPKKMAKVNLAWAKVGTPEDRAKYDAHLATLGGQRPSATSAAEPSGDLTTDGMFDMLTQAGLPAADAAEAKRLVEQGVGVIKGLASFLNRSQGQ